MAILVALSNGNEYMPVLIAGNAIVLIPILTAIFNEL